MSQHLTGGPEASVPPAQISGDRATSLIRKADGEGEGVRFAAAVRGFHRTTFGQAEQCDLKVDYLGYLGQGVPSPPTAEPVPG